MRPTSAASAPANTRRQFHANAAPEGAGVARRQMFAPLPTTQLPAPNGARSWLVAPTGRTLKWPPGARPDC